MIFAPFDTETTGLPKHPDAFLGDQPHVIEFASVLSDGKQIIETMDFICNPHVPLEAIITKITGLKDEHLVDQPDFEEFVERIAAHFAKADAVIAHNLAFDKLMLENELRRIGLTLADVNWPPIEICTIEQTFHQYGRMMKMNYLYDSLVGQYVQKHRALDDVKLLNELCQVMGVYDVFSAA